MESMEELLESVAKEAYRNVIDLYRSSFGSSEKDVLLVLQRRLLPLLEAGHKPKHDECEDCYYSCPKAEDYCGGEIVRKCNCGKDEYDAALAAARRQP